jgi:flagellar hook protein FlgE
MLLSLNSAVSGLHQFQNELDVIGNNIANSNTLGYKSSRTEFEDSFAQTLRAASGGSTGVQVGSGVGTGGVRNLFTQGTVSSTGLASDLAINGDGFFIVKDVVSGEEFATRAGNFRLTTDGYLVTNNGYRLQGYSDAGLTTSGDVRVDKTGMPATADPAATISGFSIDSSGKVTVTLSDNSKFVRGQVLLQSFTDPQALEKSGENLYSGLDAAGPLGGAGSRKSAAPGTTGLGDLKAGALELSNVDLTNEFASLITTQRGFQANARVITTSDEVLQELVNLKR